MDTITTQAMDTKFIYMHVYSHVNHKYKFENGSHSGYKHTNHTGHMDIGPAHIMYIYILLKPWTHYATTQGMEDELVHMHISTYSNLETT